MPARSPSPHSSRREEHPRSRSPRRRRRSSSRSPAREHHYRSRSPRSPPSAYYDRRKRQRSDSPSGRDDRVEEHRSRKQIPKGFKWKDAPSARRDLNDDERGGRAREHERLERGYRDRSHGRHGRQERPRGHEREQDEYSDRDRHRDRDRGHDRNRRRESERGEEQEMRSSHSRTQDTKAPTPPPASRAEDDRTTETDARVLEKFGDVRPRAPKSTARSGSDSNTNNGSALTTQNNGEGNNNDSDRQPPKKPKKDKKPPTVAPTSEPLIVVNVNDRLGTKAAIPCLASDPVRLFKAQVAARIGREPHEIMLKRQGERPFKDKLTLEDYGVSNGVQLDLEVDTGD